MSRCLNPRYPRVFLKHNEPTEADTLWVNVGELMLDEEMHRVSRPPLYIREMSSGIAEAEYQELTQKLSQLLSYSSHIAKKVQGFLWDCFECLLAFLSLPLLWIPFKIYICYKESKKNKERHQLFLNFLGQAEEILSNHADKDRVTLEYIHTKSHWEPDGSFRFPLDQYGLPLLQEGDEDDDSMHRKIWPPVGLNIVVKVGKGLKWPQHQLDAARSRIFLKPQFGLGESSDEKELWVNLGTLYDNCLCPPAYIDKMAAGMTETQYVQVVTQLSGWFSDRPEFGAKKSMWGWNNTNQDVQRYISKAMDIVVGMENIHVKLVHVEKQDRANVNVMDHLGLPLLFFDRKEGWSNCWPPLGLNLVIQVDVCHTEWPPYEVEALVWSEKSAKPMLILNGYSC
jgi:hypothetical protein